MEVLSFEVDAAMTGRVRGPSGGQVEHEDGEESPDEQEGAGRKRLRSSGPLWTSHRIELDGDHFIGIMIATGFYYIPTVSVTHLQTTLNEGDGIRSGRELLDVGYGQNHGAP